MIDVSQSGFWWSHRSGGTFATGLAFFFLLASTEAFKELARLLTMGTELGKKIWQHRLRKFGTACVSAISDKKLLVSTTLMKRIIKARHRLNDCGG